jgi:hypothetical protein
MFSLRSNCLTCGALLASLATTQYLSPRPQPHQAARCHHAQIRRRPPQGRSRGGAHHDDRRARIGKRVRNAACKGGPVTHDDGAVAARGGARAVLAIAASRRHQSRAVRRASAPRREPEPVQLTRLANEGGRVTVANDLLASMTMEAKRLRLALRGVCEAGNDR